MLGIEKLFARFKRVEHKQQKTVNRKNKLIIDNGESFEKDLMKRTIGVSTSRLDGDFQEQMITGSINKAIRASAVQVRDQSRTIAVNSPFGKRAVQYQIDNVIGADGINPQPRVMDNKGNLNKVVNDKILRAFQHWCFSRERFSRNGRMNFRTFSQLIERARMTDGEVFIRIHEADEFKIELIEAERCEYGQSELCENGNTILNGIEYDVESGKAVRYWFTQYDFMNQCKTGRRYGVPASECIHYYSEMFVGQLRGIPEFVANISTLIQYDAYSKATLVQKRAAASSMGFITQDKDSATPMDLGLDGEEDDQYEPPEIIQEFEAGTIHKLPAGMDVKQFTTTQGGDGFDTFSSKLEGQMAMGFGFYKQGWLGDTAGVNYSSARFGDMAQRQLFRSIQRTLQEVVLEVIYERWLAWAILTDKLDIPMTKVHEIVNSTTWTVPKYESVDPQKDVNTEIAKVESGFKSRSDVILESGQDPQSVFAQIDSEKNLYVPKQANKVEVAQAPIAEVEDT